MDLDLNNEEDVIKLKKIAKALSSLKRINILRYSKLGIDSYGEISDKIDRSPTALTNHMKWIMDSGLIEIARVKGANGKIKKVPRLVIKEINIKF